jgi:secreted Zn-dependent insulinase-like peptidase
MVGKLAQNQEHPGSKFTIGSLDTLQGDIHEDLTQFFNSQYSADQMGLVLIADQPLDTLEAWVTPLFSKIANKDIGPDYPDMPVFTSAHLPAKLEIQSLKDGAKVGYTFPLPTTRAHYKTKPEQYFTNLLGHEGKGSLYQQLSSYGWIESLSASVGDLDRNASALSVAIELTPQGRAKIEEITDLLFQYIELIRRPHHRNGCTTSRHKWRRSVSDSKRSLDPPVWFISSHRGWTSIRPVTCWSRRT